MTCFSREDLSFKIFLKPFELEVWIALLVTMVITVIVCVAILITKLKWGFLDALSLSQLAVVSIVLEKPTDIERKIGRIRAFKFLFGLWLLLVPILTNGYLGLSITEISSPLESRSVTRFDQLSQPGCKPANNECHISRIKKFHKSLKALWKHWDTSWRRATYIEPFWVANRPTIEDLLRTATALRNQSIRKFDLNQDFVLLPYSLDENLFSNLLDHGNNFDRQLKVKLKSKLDKILPKLELDDKIISTSSMEILKLLDLIDPLHIPHPILETFTDTKYIGVGY